MGRIENGEQAQTREKQKKSPSGIVHDTATKNLSRASNAAPRLSRPRLWFHTTLRPKLCFDRGDGMIDVIPGSMCPGLIRPAIGRVVLALDRATPVGMIRYTRRPADRRTDQDNPSTIGGDPPMKLERFGGLCGSSASCQTAEETCSPFAWLEKSSCFARNKQKIRLRQLCPGRLCGPAPEKSSPPPRTSLLHRNRPARAGSLGPFTSTVLISFADTSPAARETPLR